MRGWGWIALAAAALLAVLAVAGLWVGRTPQAPLFPAPEPKLVIAPPEAPPAPVAPKAAEPPPVLPVAPAPHVQDEAQVMDDAAAVGMTTQDDAAGAEAPAPAPPPAADEPAY